MLMKSVGLLVLDLAFDLSVTLSPNLASGKFSTLLPLNGLPAEDLGVSANSISGI